MVVVLPPESSRSLPPAEAAVGVPAALVVCEKGIWATIVGIESPRTKMLLELLQHAWLATPLPGVTQQ